MTDTDDVRQVQNRHSRSGYTSIGGTPSELSFANLTFTQRSRSCISFGKKVRVKSVFLDTDPTMDWIGISL